MLDEFAEGFARHVDAGEELEACLGPACNTARERVEVRVAALRKNLSGALGQAVGVVAQHDVRAAPRHQTGESKLEPAQRHRAREQEMVLRKDQLFAQIDERQLLPIGEHRLEGWRIHSQHSDSAVRRLTSPAAASSARPCPRRDRSARARSYPDWCLSRARSGRGRDSRSNGSSRPDKCPRAPAAGGIS